MEIGRLASTGILIAERTAKPSVANDHSLMNRRELSRSDAQVSVFDEVETHP